PPYVSPCLAECGPPSEIAAEPQRCRLTPANGAPHEWNAQAPQCRGRQDRAPTDVMHDVEIFGDVQPTRLCQCRTLPAKIVDANAAFPLLRLSRHIDPNHMRCWTAVFEELGLRRLPVQRMRQDPRVMMPGQVPGPVPGKPRLRTLPWPEG